MAGVVRRRGDGARLGLDLDELAEIARRQVTRNLTDAECQRYLRQRVRPRLISAAETLRQPPLSSAHEATIRLPGTRRR